MRPLALKRLIHSPVVGFDLPVDLPAFQVQMTGQTLLFFCSSQGLKYKVVYPYFLQDPLDPAHIMADHISVNIKISLSLTDVL